MVVYVDNLLATIDDPKTIIDSFSMCDIKDKVSHTDQYLRSNVGK